MMMKVWTKVGYDRMMTAHLPQCIELIPPVEYTCVGQVFEVEIKWVKEWAFVHRAGGECIPEDWFACGLCYNEQRRMIKGWLF